MTKQKQKIQKKSLNRPDETRKFDRGKLELVTLGDMTVGRAVFEPGWRWSKSVKPIAKTEWCEAPHNQYMISGHLKVAMSDGTETEFGPGDFAVIPPGHDGWVVGDEPVVAIDFLGMKNYAKK